MDLKEIIRAIPDFPEKGITFRDITTILQDGKYFKQSIEEMAEAAAEFDFNVIVGPESRGFIFGTPLAYKLEKGFVPVRKKGKLPFKTISKSYDLEYGSDIIEMHIDAIKKGDRILIADDLLATGGTARAIVDLIEEAGGVVAGVLCLIELVDLNGRKLFDGYEVRSLIKY
ncbi:MAG: adenine phosphoribosyltransferase [Defluviitaleaceae bacterium]|nr:adenine phosphoribosyltransferase [Defluviitaleaceae bacterium]